MRRKLLLFMFVLFSFCAWADVSDFTYTANGREWKCYYLGTEAAIMGVTEGASTCSGVLNVPDVVYWSSHPNPTVAAKPLTVTMIGRTDYYIGPFQNYTLLTEVNLPASVKSIASRQAFYNCTGLTKVTMPGVESISKDAFYGCTSLADVTFPKLKSLGEGAFNQCNLQGVLTIPDAVTDIPENAFRANKHITGLVLPANVQNIGDYAFYGCEGLRGDFTLPATSMNIGRFAFSACGFDGTLTVLKQVGAGNLGEGVFGRTSFTHIVVGGEQPIAIARYFESNFSGTIAIQPNVKKIAAGAFAGLKITNSSIVIPEGVEEIGNEAFRSIGYYSGGLHKSTLQLPSTLKVVGIGAFQAANLTGALTIPKSVTSWGWGAFEKSNFTSVTFEPGLPEIGIAAFYQCASLTSVTFGSGLTKIGKEAFYDCTGLAGNLLLPDGLVEIGNRAFQNCSGLTGKLTIPNTVTKIGYCAFKDCRGLKADAANLLHPSLTAIGSNAFLNCKGITGEAILPSPYEIIHDKEGLGGDDGTPIAFPILHTSVWGIKMGPWTEFFHPNKSDNSTFNWYQDSGLYYVDASESTIALTNGKSEPNTCYKFSRDPYMYDEDIKYANFGNTSINTLIYLPSETKFNDPALPSATFASRFDDQGENFIMDGKCEHFFVKDGLSYRVPMAFTALEAKCDRTFSVTDGKAVSTLYLPYPTDLPTGMRAYYLSRKGLDGNNDNAFMFELLPYGTRLEANKPYLVQITDGQTHQLPTMHNVSVPVSPGYEASSVAATDDSDWKFYGTAERINNEEASEKKAYYLSGNKWWAVRNGVENDYIAPFRAFICSPTGVVPSKSFAMVLDGDNDVTGINKLESKTSDDIKSGKYTFYSVDGKPMGNDYDKLERGQIYIVNGNKFYKF